MTVTMSELDIVIDAIARGEPGVIVILAEPRLHPDKPGTNGRYNRGCRCTDCRAAHAKHSRSWRHAARTRRRHP